VCVLKVSAVSRTRGALEPAVNRLVTAYLAVGNSLSANDLLGQHTWALESEPSQVVQEVGETIGRAPYVLSWGFFQVGNPAFLHAIA